jgi:hypothetical protein
MHRTYTITDNGLQDSSSASDERTSAPLGSDASLDARHVGAAGSDSAEQMLFEQLERAARRERDARMKADQALDEWKRAEHVFNARASGMSVTSERERLRGTREAR